MDRRLQIFPPLPRQDVRIPLVLPTHGDLRVRLLLPREFLSQFHIHADARTQLRLYMNFEVVRKFLVLSTEGDLYTQKLRMTVRLQDLPKQQLLPLPFMASGDIVSVLDLVQCCSQQYRPGRGMQNVTWELVRVRWRNNLETWMPLQIIASRYGDLLQRFYINSFNSWQKMDRIQRQNFAKYKSEVELWLQHEEFEKFFRQLHKRHRHRANKSIYNVTHPDYSRLFPAHDRKEGILANAFSASGASSASSASSASCASSAPTTATTRTNSNSNHVNTAANSYNNNSSRVSEAAPRVAQPATQHELPVSVRPSPNRNSTANDRQPDRNGTQSTSASSQPTGRGQDADRARVSPSKSKEKGPRSSQPSHQDIAPMSSAPIAVSPSPPLSKHKRKRLRMSQAVREDSEDESDDALIDIPSREAAAATTTTIHPTSQADGATSQSTADLDLPRSRLKKGKRLRQVQVLEDSDDEDILPELDSSASTTPTSQDGSNVFSHLTTETDVSLSQELSTQANTAIRCVCGGTSIDRYTGQWLQCWNEDCGVWEHAECVGCLVVHADDDVPVDYLCSNCDNEAYQTRIFRARKTPVAWIEQCCDTNNARFLLYLLKSIWDPQQQEHEQVAMRVMRTGLLKCVEAVMLNKDFNIFVTDDQSRNVLHHCALGDSARVFAKMYDLEVRLLTHQDRKGQTPFHYLLKSLQLNSLCGALLKFLPRLAVESDHFARSPLHFSMQAITNATTGIVQAILEVEPSAIFAKTLDGITPLMVLFQTPVLDDDQHEKLVKSIVKEILRVDFLGGSLNETDNNGWTVLHHAAVSSNCGLFLRALLPLQAHTFMDLNATIHDSHQTALHLAASSNDALGIRQLLSLGLDPLAVDDDGLVPLFYARSPDVIRELLTCDPEIQMMRLLDRYQSFQWRERVKSLLRMLVRVDDCFDIINDYFTRKWRSPEGLKSTKCLRLLTESRYLLTLSNKLKYVKCVCREFVARNALQEKTSTCVVATSKKTCWDDLLRHFREQGVAAFRNPITFAFQKDKDINFSSHNLTEMLILRNWVFRAISRRPYQLFTRQKDGPVRLMAATPATAAVLDQMIVLGAFIAHLVLFGYCIGIKFDLQPQFLLSVARQECETEEQNSLCQVAAQMFGFGFEQVLPGMLDLFDAVELRVLLYARRAKVDAAKLISCTSASDFVSDARKNDVLTWFSSLVNELSGDGRILLVVQLAGTAAIAVDNFACFLDREASQMKKMSPVFPAGFTMRPHGATTRDGNCRSAHQLKHVTVDLSTFTLYIPDDLDSYEAFRADVMETLIRRTGNAFLPS